MLRAPWECFDAWMSAPEHPQYWNDPPLDPVSCVTKPAASNPHKGAGVSLTAEEIERVRAEQRAAFKERLGRAWTWRLHHL